MCKKVRKNQFIFSKISSVIVLTSLLMLFGCANGNNDNDINALRTSSLSTNKGEKKWFRDRAFDYTRIEANASVKVPKDLQAEDFSEEYKIPGG